jgi:NTE family protein
LVEACPARNVVLVQINPLLAGRAPRTPREIRNRIAEIAFGRPLAEELERLHHIDGSAELARLDPGTKVDPKWPLLLDLRDRG